MRDDPAWRSQAVAIVRILSSAVLRKVLPNDRARPSARARRTELQLIRSLEPEYLHSEAVQLWNSMPFFEYCRIETDRNGKSLLELIMYQLVECAVQSLQHPRSRACRLLLAGAVAMSTGSAFAQATPPIAAPLQQPGPQGGPQSGAQPGTPPDAKALAQRAAYDVAFQATLDKPSDPTVLVNFAKIAVTMGDVEGAISALERLLLVEGD